MVVRYHYLRMVRFMRFLINFNYRYYINTGHQWATHHDLVVVFAYMTRLLHYVYILTIEI
jgi:hypothetical protein